MTPQEMEQVHTEWREFLPVLRKSIDEQKNYGQTLGDTNAKLDAINARMDAIEMASKRRPLANDGKKLVSRIEIVPSTPERKAAFDKFLRHGDAALNNEEKRALVVERKTMTVGDDTAGGYLADDEMVGEIIKDIVEWSPLRQYARVRTTSQRSVKIRKKTGTTSARWVGAERGTKTQTGNLKYGLEEVPNHELYAFVDISNQDLEDSSFDLEAELNMEISEQFGVAEALSFLEGDGVGQPEGILATGNGISTDTTGAASTLTYNGLVDVSHNMKSAHAAQAIYAFNRKTLGVIRKMVDANDVPLWTPMAQGAPATVLGSPYAEFPQLADVAANAFPVLFGNFRRGYLIVDRLQIAMLRDNVTQATEGAVRFIARKRVGGQVIQAEAIRKLKVAV